MVVSSTEVVYSEYTTEPLIDMEASILESNSGNIDSEDDNNAAVLFEQRQRQYLNGRRATKTIVDSTGSVIISEGMLIDDQVIDEVKLKGKLIELVMNNRA